MTKSDLNHVDWLAFRYVSEEMTAEEATQWELRLADDQTAREAVASAVELLQAVRELPQESWPSPLVAPISSGSSDSSTHLPHRPRMSRTWKLGLSAAAAAAMVIGVCAVSQLLPPGGSPALQPLEVDDELATVWSLTRASSAVESVEDTSTDVTTAMDEWPASPDVDVIASDRPMPSTPSWMLAGMAGLVAEHDESETTSEPAVSKDL